jgi:molybdopterin-guanine dinucleotide biosynthesis protein A
VKNIDAFILIGGRSSRLGRAKAFVEFDGDSLAARASRVVEEALSPAHITFVTSSQDQFAADLLFGLGHPIVSDLRPGFGAWSGVHAALAYARSEWAFVFACDLPFITAEFLILLRQRMENETEAVVPRQADKRLQPLCALYRVSALRDRIDEMLRVPRSLPALATIAELAKTRIVEPNEWAALPGADKFFHNVNTQDDVRTSS